MIDKSVGQRIRQLREAAGLSPDELAEKAGPEGPSAYTIAMIEAGRARPFGPFLAAIAKALSVTTSYILSGRNEPEDEAVRFANSDPDLVGLGLQRKFVAYAKDTSFRHKNLTPEELRILKREFLRSRM